jgi:hypothetical protein
VVDGSGLENRHTRKGIGGSNPSLSARFFNPSNLSRIYRLLHSLTRRLLAVSWCPVGVPFDFYGQGNSAKLPKQGQ